MRWEAGLLTVIISSWILVHVRSTWSSCRRTKHIPGCWRMADFLWSVPVLDFQKKVVGPAGPQVFIFCRQNKYSGRQELYLRINGFSFLKDNGLSLVYVFPERRVTYLGGQVSDQVWKFGHHWAKAGRIGDPTGRNVKPCVHPIIISFLSVPSQSLSYVKSGVEKSWIPASPLDKQLSHLLVLRHFLLALSNDFV